jgi:hypothetical protein
MRRAWPVAVVLLALVACWDFDGAYQQCLDSGRCSGGGSDGGVGGGDAGDDGGGIDGGTDAGTCPTGAPTGNGLCLVARYDRQAPMYGIYAVSPNQIYFGGFDEAFTTYLNGVLQDGVTGIPIGNELADLSGISANEIWAGVNAFGGGPYVYRFDGLQWADVTPPTLNSGDCHGVWAEGAGFAWIACDNGIYRVTSAGSFQRVATTAGLSFNGVWGLPGGPAWAVGSDLVGSPSLWERRSGTWRAVSNTATGSLAAVHGRSDHDVWAVGAPGLLMHLNDAGWQEVNSALVGNLHDVFVTSAGETWVTEGTNRVMVIDADGGQRTFVPPGVPGVPGSIMLQQVQVFDTGDVWFTGITDDGGTEFNGLEMHFRKL